MQFNVWTLALQAINVVVLVWLLQRFLFRPVIGIVAQRRAAADAVMAEAEAIRAAAQAEAASLAGRRQALAAEGERIVAAAHDRAGEETEAARAAAEAALAREREAAEAALVRQRAEMQATLRNEAGMLAVDIARRLLGRAPSVDVTEVLVRETVSRLASLPLAERVQLAAGPVEVVSAVPLSGWSRAALVQVVAGGAAADAAAAAAPCREAAKPAGAGKVEGGAKAWAVAKRAKPAVGDAVPRAGSAEPAEPAPGRHAEPERPAEGTPQTAPLPQVAAAGHPQAAGPASPGDPAQPAEAEPPAEPAGQAAAARQAEPTGAAEPASPAEAMSPGADPAAAGEPPAERTGRLGRVSFRVDPALLAGVELHAPHTLIRNHWRADLERIVAKLRDEAGDAA